MTTQAQGQLGAYHTHQNAQEDGRDIDRRALLTAATRLREALTDNALWSRMHERDFKAYAAGQKPRATLLACSDARVQTSAIDATPENDVFVVRDIGNQVATAAGSLAYGVHHLHTPLLLVLGHTGCGAVRAAMGDFAGEPEPIRRELATLDVPRATRPTIDDAAWADAVVANVHTQVAAAVAAWPDDVEEGRLTVVGAVYDFRNDLKKGPGRVVIVDVNGHGDEKKVAAFVRAIERGDAPKESVLDRLVVAGGASAAPAPSR